MVVNIVDLLGSSPRMRGALASESGWPALDGIIPAYAGSTTAHWMAACATWDHPRVCGEHTKVPRAIWTN